MKTHHSQPDTTIKPRVENTSTLVSDAFKNTQRERCIVQFTLLKDEGYSGVTLEWCGTLEQHGFHVTEDSVNMVCTYGKDG